MRPVRYKALAFLCFALLGACKSTEYQKVGFSSVSKPPPGISMTLSSEAIGLHVGIATDFKAKPISNEKEYDEKTDFELSSRDDSLFRVERTLEKRRFVIWGISPGTSCLEVLVDNQEKECINVEVRETAK